jgi:hypothetical protein
MLLIFEKDIAPTIAKACDYGDNNAHGKES